MRGGGKLAGLIAPRRLRVALLRALGDGLVAFLGAGDGHGLVALLGDGVGDVLHLRYVSGLRLYHLVLVGDELGLVLGLVLGGHGGLDLEKKSGTLVIETAQGTVKATCLAMYMFQVLWVERK